MKNSAVGGNTVMHDFIPFLFSNALSSIEISEQNNTTVPFSSEEEEEESVEVKSREKDSREIREIFGQISGRRKVSYFKTLRRELTGEGKKGDRRSGDDDVIDVVLSGKEIKR